MPILESLKQGIQEHFEKKKLERENVEKIKKENSIEAQQIFEKEFRENNKKVLIARAKKDAAKLSGLQKFRANERLRNLNKESNPENFWSKLREHTQKNLANREENLKRTEERRKLAKQMRDEQIQKRQLERFQRLENRKPFYT